MLFNSYGFILVFLPIVLGVFFALGRYSVRAAAVFLTAASLVFYAWEDVSNLWVIVPSILANYAFGLYLARHPRKSVLTVAVSLNLAALFVFKYLDFVWLNLSALWQGQPQSLGLELPIGISFFTFTQIAYLVDVYRGKAKEANPVHYTLFVTYFPHLIAGPILHHAQMMPQFADPRTYRPSAPLWAMGWSIFALGLSKKVLIADPLALIANPVFDQLSTTSVDIVQVWLAGLAYTFQLYFDFSGYSDMAIGLSLLLGIQLPLNFFSPYRATSIIEFWRRWHISLSTFLRDYLYIPLGGNQKGPVRRYVNLFLTMLLGGMWHGANWTFVAWGALHGSYLILNHAWRSLGPAWVREHQWWPMLAGVLTFVAVVVAWVFFRANSLADALLMLRQMVALDTLRPLSHEELKVLPGLVGAGLVCWCLPNTAQVFHLPGSLTAAPERWHWRASVFWLLLCAGLLVACLYSLNNISQFIYFRF